MNRVIYESLNEVTNALWGDARFHSIGSPEIVVNEPRKIVVDETKRRMQDRIHAVAGQVGGIIDQRNSEVARIEKQVAGLVSTMEGLGSQKQGAQEKADALRAKIVAVVLKHPDQVKDLQQAHDIELLRVEALGGEIEKAQGQLEQLREQSRTVTIAGRDEARALYAGLRAAFREESRVCILQAKLLEDQASELSSTIEEVR